MARNTNIITGQYSGVGKVAVYAGTGSAQLFVTDAVGPNGEMISNRRFIPSNLTAMMHRNSVSLGDNVSFTMHRASVHSSRLLSLVSVGAGSTLEGKTPSAVVLVDVRGESNEAAAEREAAAAIGNMLRNVVAWNVAYRTACIAMAQTIRAMGIAFDERPVVVSTLDRLLKYMSARDSRGHTLNVMMVGPAGSGKSTVAQLAAEKLGLAFYSDSFNRDTPPWQLTGQYKPLGNDTWAYVPSAFVLAYENGGVYLADEMDAADANTLLTLNMALANGHMNVAERHDNPTATRHADFYCLAACNTYGAGSRVYVGREELDEATLSRFVPMSVDYDPVYEAGVLANAGTHAAELREFRDTVRKVITTAKLRRVWSTRHLIQWVALRNAGIAFAEIKREYFAAWSVADRTAFDAASKPVAPRGY